MVATAKRFFYAFLIHTSDVPVSTQVVFTPPVINPFSSMFYNLLIFIGWISEVKIRVNAGFVDKVQ